MKGLTVSEDLLLAIDGLLWMGTPVDGDSCGWGLREKKRREGKRKNRWTSNLLTRVPGFSVEAQPNQGTIRRLGNASGVARAAPPPHFKNSDLLTFQSSL
jgi:hypothetical protein